MSVGESGREGVEGDKWGGGGDYIGFCEFLFSYGFYSDWNGGFVEVMSKGSGMVWFINLKKFF